jgi:hypothetical protein
MNDEINQLTEKKITVSCQQSLIDFKDLDLLEAIAREQMQFPAWKRSNPERTRQLEDVLHRLQAVEDERHQRCHEFAQALGRWNQQQISEAVKSQLPRLSVVPEPK